MNQIVQFFPIFLMIISGYFLIKYYKKNKGKIMESLSEEQIVIWKKARGGLYFTIPMIGAIVALANGKKMMNFGPVIINFYLTKYVFKVLLKKGLSIPYPKLYAIGISTLLFIIQVTIGTIVMSLMNI